MKSIVRGVFHLIVISTVFAPLMGCRPQTTGQKVEDAAEDARHEAKQAAERVGENINSH